jgi:hypothetical protein
MTTLIDDSTLGYYNQALGTVLDGTQLQFPPANSYGNDEPVLPNAAEPNLTPAASILGDWLTDPSRLNANWSALQTISKSWPANIEIAVIYPIDAGPEGVSQLIGNFGVDNGIFVWVNGVYKFGATAPGNEASIDEYSYIDLGDLPSGINYLQILLEDHSDFGSYSIKVLGLKSR